MFCKMPNIILTPAGVEIMLIVFCDDMRVTKNIKAHFYGFAICHRNGLLHLSIAV